MDSILVIKGKYKGLTGHIVQNFKTNALILTEKTSLGGRYQEFYGGWVIKVKHENILKENK